MKDDPDTARQFFGLLDLVASLAVAFPAQVFRAVFPGSAENLHLVRDHESRVKTHPELPNQTCRAAASFLHLL